MHTKVVVLGGGTGIYPVTAALKHLPVEISTIVAVSDSGGSTGRIRDEFGFQPVGDLRQSLAALAEDSGQAWIRKLLLYRFNKGEGLTGHNLGNLILTALQDLTGSTDQALEIAQKIFRLDGQVIPATTANVQLKIVYTDGSTQIGEHVLDEVSPAPRRIDHIELEPPAALNPRAAAAIAQANLIIIGPGDYFASLMAALCPTGCTQALTDSPARLLYIGNLMTRATQTQGMTAAEHVTNLEKLIGRQFDTILLNQESIPTPVLKLYAEEGEEPVLDDLVTDQRVIRADLLNPEIRHLDHADTSHRSLLRHDVSKLTQVLERLLNEHP